MENVAVYCWLAAMLVMIVLEFATVTLTTVWFAVGALAAMIVAMCHWPWWLQLLVFTAVSVVLLIFTRPLIQKHVNARVQKTNADSLVGTEIRIAERVSNIDETGMAVVQGREWTVRSSDNSVLEPGDLATVVEIQGVKLIVEKKN